MKSPLASDKYSEKNISGISVFENNEKIVKYYRKSIKKVEIRRKLKVFKI